jgi:hypothetical protein
MATTTANTLCSELSKAIGDYIEFDTTTNLAASKLVVSTTLNQYDRASDDYFNNWFVYITEGNNIGVERQVSDYATSTGTLTVYGANFSADAGAMTCELRRYSRAKCLKAINESTKEIFPNLGEYYEDTSIVTGNWLPNGHFDKFTLTTVPDLYSLSSVTSSAVTTAGLTVGGYSSALLTASAGNGYLSISSDTYPRLLQLMNTQIDFKCWAYPSVADDFFLVIYTLQADGTAQTLTSTTTTYASKWNLVTLEDQMLNDNLVKIEFRFKITTNAATAYVDNAQVFGRSIDQYLLPTTVRTGKVMALYVQTGQYSNEYLDPCDNQNPESWSRLYNWHYWFDGTYDWIEIPNQQDRYKIRAITMNPLDQLSAGTDTVNIDGKQINLLLAYAKYKLWQQEKGLPSTQDNDRLDKWMSEALAEYNRLLPKLKQPQVLETVRVRY